jgi:tetratricopeptide (TPR) repeat protein
VRLVLQGLGALLLAASVQAQTAKPPLTAPDLQAIAGMIQKGQLGPAEQQLRRILAQGASPTAHDLLGVVLVAQGRGEEAERELKQALAANPALIDGHQHLARLYLSQKRDAEAIAELRRAAHLGPLERDLALRLAAIERVEGNVVLAERQLRSVADRFKSVQALLQLARLQSDQKNAAGALASLRLARAIAPNSEDVLSAYAEAVIASPTPDAAVPVLSALTRLYPTVARYHYRQGLALLGAGDAAAAAASLQEAARLEPDQPATLIALGRALDRRELYSEAKPHLLRGLSLAPDNVEAVAALAEAEEGLGELKDAEEHARRVLARSGTDATAKRVIAMVRMKQDRFAEARDALLEAAAADPASSKVEYQLSQAYARLNDPVTSEKHLALYHQKLKEGEERVKELRRVTGFSIGGTQP